MDTTSMHNQQFRTREPDPVWTHDSDRGDQGRVFDADGNEVGVPMRVNVHSGFVERIVHNDLGERVRDAAGRLVTELVQCKAPLTVMPLRCDEHKVYHCEVCKP